MEIFNGVYTGNFFQCSSQCRSCSGEPSTCLSCPSGFKLSGNKCVSSVNVGCSIVLRPLISGWSDSASFIVRRRLFTTRWTFFSFSFIGLFGTRCQKKPWLFTCKRFRSGSIAIDSVISVEDGESASDVYNSVASAM